MEMPPPDLTDHDKAIIAELLHETIERCRFRLLSPRVRNYRAILAKLAPLRLEPPLPPPKPPGEHSMVLTRKRRRLTPPSKNGQKAAD
jgi:hypothetical protein